MKQFSRGCSRIFDSSFVTAKGGCFSAEFRKQKLISEAPICNGTEFVCDSGQCIPLKKQCDTVVDCFDRSDEIPTSCLGNCDFENNNCNWKDITIGTQFNWTRHQGYSPSWYTGPDSDHTTG